jgi:hypothetical protein
MQAKFLPTDEPSFSEWMYKIPLVPTAPDTFTMFMNYS